MRQSERGYVLILVMGALALLALVASRLAVQVQTLREQAATVQQEFDHERRALEAWHEVLYATMGSAPGPAGWGPLRGDGRRYRTSQGAIVEFLDERGLLSVNLVDRALWHRLLEPMVPDLMERDALLDVLQDYTDVDTARRLNGAEFAEYEALGLPAPRNDWMLSLKELERLPLWRDRWEAIAPLRPWLTTGFAPGLNLNTAPVPLLKRLLPGQTEDAWALFEMSRERQPFLSAQGVRAGSGIAVPDDGLTFYAGMRLQVRIWPAEGRQGLQYNLLLNPAGASAPWLVSAVEPIAGSAPPSLDRDAIPLPLDVSTAASSPSLDSPRF